MEIDVRLEVTELEMPISIDGPTQVTVQGWVVMSKKPPGETVPVEFSAVSQEGGVYGSASPGALYFHREETQYFNLTVWLAEDAIPHEVHHLELNAFARSKLGHDGDSVTILVTGVPDFAAEAETVEQPGKVNPGGSASGVVQVLNTGTMWSTYLPSIRTNPDGVISSIEFDIKVELPPYLLKKVPFEIWVSKDAQSGIYQVTLGLMAAFEDGTTVIMDTFDVNLTVVEPPDESGVRLGAVLLVAMLVAAPVAISVRRKP